ncbi:MOSC domain-containing protein [Consotaella aegiceratis]|uniref:MOSC domain-containing protein n=1 Tax=Consotaella aegiceratis TaxID=3097961 RepID=UPI002F3F3E27
MTQTIADGQVLDVARDSSHRFSKQPTESIQLVAGLGVEGDAHLGATVQHRSRVAADPTQPNLRQVHLIHTELFDELKAEGFAVAPGDLGENITTTGIDLLALPVGTLLAIGETALIALTGLRNPCAQIEKFQAGLLKAVLPRGPDGQVIRKAGVMAVVLSGGPVRPGDAIRVSLPPEPHHPLERI